MQANLRTRQLHESDRGSIENYWLSLSLDERRKRFHSAVSDEMLRAQVRRINFSSDSVLGVYHDGRLCGTAELMANGQSDDGGVCELAIVLSAPAKGSGIASSIIQTLRKLACALGHGAIELCMEPDNRPMVRLAIKNGFFISHDQGGMTGRSKISSHVPGR